MKTRNRISGSQPKSGERPESQGMILLLSLAMLAGLSLLAVLSASSMLQQRMMAANHSDGELARLAAVTAVAAGEEFLFGLPKESRAENCWSDCYTASLPGIIHNFGTLPEYPEFLPDDWWLQWGLDSASVVSSKNNMNLSVPVWPIPGRQPPQFVIEEVEYQIAGSSSSPLEAPLISGVAYYRILGRGTGLADHSTHVMESIMARPWQGHSTESDTTGISCSTFRPWYDCGRMAFRERR